MKSKHVSLLFIFVISVIFVFACRGSETDTQLSVERDRVFDRRALIQDGVIWDIPDVPRWCDRLDLQKKRIDIGGCELYVEEQGSGAPVVLLHGGPGSTHHEFHPVFDRASEFARVIYYDQRGCGLSDYKPEAGYSMDQAASDLDRLREKLGIDKWVVLGHSYGGFLAQYYTSLFPEHVSGLVVVCGSPGMHDRELFGSRQWDFISSEEREAMRRHRNEIRKRSKEENWSHEKTLAVEVFNNHVNGDWKRQSYYRPSMEQFAHTALYNWKHDFKNNFNRVMSRSQRAISLKGDFVICPLPTLIMESLWDLTWEESKAFLLAKNHPAANMIVFTKSGHSPFEDEPDLFFRRLKDFVYSITPVPDAAIAAFKEFLRNSRDTFDDPFLTDPVTDAEKRAIARYREVFARIKGGERYFDLSSPADGMLSFYSACRDGDTARAGRIHAMYEIKKENFPEYTEWIEEIDPWRIPLPPEQPEPGQVWPLYMKNKNSGRWDDTFLFQYWRGEWKRWGNMGGPYHNWRDSSLRMQKDFLVERLK